MDSHEHEVQRLSKEEYLFDDPLLIWIEHNVEILQQRSSDFLQNGDEDGIVDVEEMLSDLEVVKKFYGNLAVHLATGNLNTIKMSKNRDAIRILRPLTLLVQRRELTDPPEWVRVAVARRSLQPHGPNTLLSEYMLDWNAELPINRKLDDIFHAALGQYSQPGLFGASVVDSHSGVEDDFKKPFLGSGAERLRRHVEDQMSKGSNSYLAYASVIPIIQSAGTGKSRTVAQLSAKNLGLFVCVRDTSHDMESFRPLQPPADQSVLHFLQEDHRFHGQYSCFRKTRVVAAWLIAMAREMTAFYEAKWHEFRKEQDDFAAFVLHVGQLLSPGETPLSPRSSSAHKVATAPFVNQRDHLLSKISDTAVILLDSPGYDVNAFVNLFASRRRKGETVVQRADTRTKDVVKPQSVHNKDGSKRSETAPASALRPDSQIAQNAPPSRYYAVLTGSRIDEGPALEAELTAHEVHEYFAAVEFFRADLDSAFAGLERFIRSNQKSPQHQRPFSHLAIDECGKMGSRLRIVRRLWSMMKSESCFLFIIDTNTQVSWTDSEMEKGSDFRLYLGEKPIRPTFSKLPRDLSLREEMLSYRKAIRGEVPTSHADLLPWLRKMGRPSLNDSWLLQAKSEKVDLNKVVDKLLGGFPGKPFQNVDTSIALALYRLHLPLVEFQGKETHPELRPGLKFVTKQVRTHMRSLSDISQRGDIMSTASCSEPLLNMAATFLFRSDPHNSWSMTMKHLKSIRTEYSLELGEMRMRYDGEEVAPILILAASDLAAVNKDRDLPLQLSSLDYELLHPVNLKDFLDALLFDGAPDSDDLDSLRQWAKGYWINFTHFAAVDTQFSDRNTYLKGGGLAMLWTRRAALTDFGAQSGCDLVIPICKSVSMPVGEMSSYPANLSLLPIQVKNQRRRDLIRMRTDFAADTVEMEDYIVHPLLATIWLDLKGPTTPCRIYYDRQNSEKQGNVDARPQVFHITARGHVAQAIKVIGSFTVEAQASIPKLLGIVSGIPDAIDLDPEDEDNACGLLSLHPWVDDLEDDAATS